MFSAKFKLISVISNTIDTWYVNAYVIDSRGVYYAADVKVDDVVYCESTEGILKFRISEVSLATGARIICKLTWLGEGTPIAPNVASQAIIGNATDVKVQGITGTFVTIINEYIDAGGTDQYTSFIDGGSPTTNYTPEQRIDAGGP